jgi:hypothetical protein
LTRSPVLTSLESSVATRSRQPSRRGELPSGHRVPLGEGFQNGVTCRAARSAAAFRSGSGAWLWVGLCDADRRRIAAPMSERVQRRLEAGDFLLRLSKPCLDLFAELLDRHRPASLAGAAHMSTAAAASRRG